MKRFESLQVIVLAGGPGTEREVSLASGRAVTEALEGRCGSVELLDVPGEDVVLPAGVDLVFNVIHGTFGEDGAVQAILERIGVPYTGAGEASSRRAFDKIRSKEQFVASGVPSPAYQVVEARPGAGTGLTLPVVIKPPREGSSVGVHIVREAEKLDEALADVARYAETALVEEFVEGKELTVSVLGEEALPIVHIQPRSGFYDMRNKYPWLSPGGGTDYFCPADLPDGVTKEVQAQALRAHRALVLLDGGDRPSVLEVNTIPGMTESSLLPKAAAAAGIPFPELCQRIGEDSLRLRGG